MKVGDIFGFFPREKRTAGDIHVIVYPKLVPLKPLSPPSRNFYGVPGGKSPVQDPIYILGTRKKSLSLRNRKRYYWPLR